MITANKRFLVTGAAGFIGFHICKRLLEDNIPVIGMDNLNFYYDPSLKKARLAILEGYRDFTFKCLDMADRKGMESLFEENDPQVVINLAAQAGVRYSVTNPHIFIDSNINGFLNVLEGCRKKPVEHLVFASSSSVYGLNRKMPFSEKDPADHPVSLYGATKKANELMAHSYSHLYGIPVTGLRFFSVYGPWGRPDMAYYKFTRAILQGDPIHLYNNGNMKRDFTYIDDVVEAVIRLIGHPPETKADWDGTDISSSSAPCRIFNVGNNDPVELERLVVILEDHLGRKAIKKLLPMQHGDVAITCADAGGLYRAVGFKPETTLEEGLGQFVEWYLETQIQNPSS